MIPLILNLKDKKILVIGGGKVALRKAKLFSGFGNVTVVSEDFLPEFEDMNVTRIKSKVGNNISAMIANADIVIAATNDRNLNQNIEIAARKMGKWVNRVDSIGDILVPSIIKRGDLTVGISTLGKSPALSKFTRMELERTLGEEYGLMAELQHEMRKKLKENVKRRKEREGILWKILEDKEVWSLLRRKDLEGARARCKKFLEKN